MLTSSLAPYLLWAKTRQPALIDLAGSNLLHCTPEDLPEIHSAIGLSARNDDGYAPVVEAVARLGSVDTARVVTAQGCSGANFITIAALVGSGDRVLLEQPSYDPLEGACRLMGARVERFPRRFEHGYHLDLGDLRRRLATPARLVILTSPHNPSGVPLDEAEIVDLARLAEAAGADLLVDEVYLDGARLAAGGTGIARSAAALDGSIFVTSSLTKSYGLAGLRCGWIIAPPGQSDRLRRTRDVVYNAGSAPADLLAEVAFAHLPRLAERARRLLTTNLDRAHRFLAATPRIEVAIPPRSSVFFPRIRGMADAAPFIAKLLDTAGVAVAPGRFFDAPAHFRISLAGPTDRLDAGLSAITTALDRPGAGA
jgi:aspartate/methionine/tyrosine aminotransferase